jgi:hypothetical protein
MGGEVEILRFVVEGMAPPPTVFPFPLCKRNKWVFYEARMMCGEAVAE